jgi:hypothetical protein
MTGARLAGHILLEGQRRKAQVRRGDHVHRRRHGRGRPVRNFLIEESNGSEFHPQEEAFRAEVQAFLAEKLPARWPTRSRPASA